MSEPLRGRQIVLGVTGSIAAFKAVALASDLVKAGALVDVVMTRAATERLEEGGVPTRRLLGQLPPGETIPDLNPRTLTRLREQARIQVARVRAAVDRSPIAGVGPRARNPVGAKQVGDPFVVLIASGTKPHPNSPLPTPKTTANRRSRIPHDR